MDAVNAGENPFEGEVTNIDSYRSNQWETARMDSLLGQVSENTMMRCDERKYTDIKMYLLFILWQYRRCMVLKPFSDYSKWLETCQICLLLYCVAN